MKKPALAVLLTLAGSLLLACGSSKLGDASSSDADGSGGAGMAGAASGADAAAGAPGASQDRCHAGCVETLAAQCANGPSDQATCETTCRELQTGRCGAEYQTFQDCAEGKALTCGANGLPVVELCSDEQEAFVACLAG